MTTMDQILGAAGGGIYLRDARDFLRWAVDTPVVLDASSLSSAPGRAAPGSAAFSTVYNTSGVLVSSTWTAGAYKTLLDISGRGLLHSVMGPRFVAGGTTTGAIRITVDGNAYEISIAALPTDRRQFLGLLTSVETGTYDTNERNTNRDVLGFRQIPNSAMLDGHYVSGAADIGIASAEAIVRTNQILAYEQSLKVEAKIGNVTSMGSGDRFAGVQYRPL